MSTIRFKLNRQRLVQLLPLFVVLFVLTLTYWALLVTSGLSAFSAMRIAIILGAQAVVGAAVLAIVTGRTIPSPSLVGYSMLIGAVVFVLTVLISAAAGFGPYPSLFIFLGVTFLAAVIATCIKSQRIKNGAGKSNAKGLLLLFLPITIGITTFIPFWRSNPTRIESWTALYGDIFYHEALSNSFAKASTDNLAALDQSIRYHWLGDAWSGLVSLVGQLAPFEALTRVLLIWSLVASVLLAAALGRFIHNSITSSTFSSTYLVVAAPIGAGLGLTYTLIIAEWSPTHIFAIPFALGLTLLALQYMDQKGLTQFQIRVLLPVALFTLSAVLTLSRIPLMMVLLGSASVLLLVAAGDRRKLTLGVKLLFLLGSGSLITWLLFIGGGPGNSIYFALNTEVSGMMGLTPISGLWGQLLSVPALLAVYGLSALGVIPLLAFGNYRQKLAAVWAITSVLGAVIFSTLLSQDGGSEITFLWAGSVIALPISAAGLALVLTRTRDLLKSANRRRNTWVAFSLSGIIIGVLYIETTPIVSSFRFAGLLRWVIPTSLFVVGIVILLISAHQSRRPSTSSQPLMVFSLTLITALSIPIGTSTAALVTQLSQESPKANSTTPLAITFDDLAAGDWVQKNTPEDAIFATTRQCGSIFETPGQCGSMLSGPAALGSRQSLIESHSYSIGEGVLSEPWLEFALDSAAPSVTPTNSSLCKLKNHGVQWLWVDMLTLADGSESLKTLNTLANNKFENSRVAIFDLEGVACN